MNLASDALNICSDGRYRSELTPYTNLKNNSRALCDPLDLYKSKICLMRNGKSTVVSSGILKRYVFLKCFINVDVV